MSHDESHRRWGPFVWGVFLIGVGTALLLERFGLLNIPPIGHLWPLVFVVLGVVRLAERQPGSALMFFALGAWFLACNSGWKGLTYGNSWPLLIVAVGLKIVIQSISGERSHRRRQRGTCCV